MPIYEYRCTSCSAELEKLQKISDPPLVQCPECGKDALVKLVSASSFRLKGSGWYETDFKTGKKKNGAGDGDASGSGAASDSAKTADGGTTTSAAAGDGKGSTDAGKGAAAKGASEKGASGESKPSATSADSAAGAGKSAANKSTQ